MLSFIKTNFKYILFVIIAIASFIGYVLFKNKSSIKAKLQMEQKLLELKKEQLTNKFMQIQSKDSTNLDKLTVINNQLQQLDADKKKLESKVRLVENAKTIDEIDNILRTNI